MRFGRIWESWWRRWLDFILLGTGDPEKKSTEMGIKACGMGRVHMYTTSQRTDKAACSNRAISDIRTYNNNIDVLTVRYQDN